MSESEKKWTPGPWVPHYITGDRGQIKGKKILSSIYVPIPGQRYGSAAIVLSPAWSEFDGGLWEAWLQCKPEDAHLIKAAPDLYEALELALEGECPVCGWRPGHAPACEAAAALAKARGEETTP